MLHKIIVERNTQPLCKCAFVIYRLQAGATAEGILPYVGDAFRNHDGSQMIATVEGRASDARDAARDFDACQPRATVERRISDARDAAPNRDLSQPRATVERRISDARDAARNFDAVQILAVTESVLTDRVRLFVKALGKNDRGFAAGIADEIAYVVVRIEQISVLVYELAFTGVDLQRVVSGVAVVGASFADA